MSYDLPVWEGEVPQNNEAALAQFVELMDDMESSEPSGPSSRIRAFVEALLAKWPDIDDAEDSPLHTCPLMDEASGSLVYFPMGYGRAGEVSTVAATLARDMGLVCFDPQIEALL